MGYFRFMVTASSYYYECRDKLGVSSWDLALYSEGGILKKKENLMANVVVVGAQWGDEGKGKIVDWLSERADVIARFQGGHNAGHTLVIDGKVYKLHALPSGVVRGGKLSVIGNGVVLDPWHLLKEIETIKSQGVKINPENLGDISPAMGSLLAIKIGDRIGNA